MDVSRLCLGCMNFGSERDWMLNDTGASVSVIHEAVEAGINFLDTANVYDSVRSYFTTDNWAVLDAVRSVADAVDATPTQVALAWLLEQNVVTAPIVGPKTSEQLRAVLGALDVTLTDDQVDHVAAPKTPTYSRPVS